MNVAVAIIGAGPYGLSLAANLRARHVQAKVFGRPMDSWRNQMPEGMLLKSDGFASSLHAPGAGMPLRRYCEMAGIEYADLGIPVKLETFVAYGMAFQQRFVPDIDQRLVDGLDHDGREFVLRLEDGQTVTAGSVVVATGIAGFAHMPEELAGLPREIAMHSSAIARPNAFSGRKIVVLGGGASAVDVATLMREAGADVRLVTRRAEFHLHSAMRLPRPLSDRMRAPISGIGPGWRSRFYTDAALAFHMLPPERRLRITKAYLGPAGGWFMKDRVEAVTRHLGFRLRNARVSDGQAVLTFAGLDGAPLELRADHVVAATGFKIGLSGLRLLSEPLRGALATEGENRTPILTRNFESTVPGLYFAGPMAANSFGPMLRFAFGSAFAARRLSAHLARAGRLADGVRFELTVPLRARRFSRPVP